MKPQQQNESWWIRLLVAAGHIHLVILFGWAVLQMSMGDRWGWLFLLNTFAFYLFLPLPLVLIAAWGSRRRELWVGLLVGIGLWLYGYGGLFWPKSPAALADHHTVLRVMSYNTLGFNDDVAAAVTVIRTSEADVVAVQELSPALAAVLKTELAEIYPYQVLDPQVGVTGMGVISRYPLRPIPTSFPGAWVGRPQAVTLDLAGQPVTLLNFHAVPPQMYAHDLPSLFTGMAERAREREQQVEAILAFAAAHTEPLLVAGDLNAGQWSTAYKMLTAVLHDGWREAGWGLGHTFSATRPAYARHTVRIDYLFHSDHWQAVGAEVGRSSGGSDHYPVVVDLLLHLNGATGNSSPPRVNSAVAAVGANLPGTILECAPADGGGYCGE